MLRGDSYGEVLSDPNFRRLWLGQLLSHLGQAIVTVAVVLYVYDLTGSAQEVSLAIALELLPWVIVGPLAGALADVLDRKVMLVAAYLLQAGLVTLLALATTLAQVYALVFAGSLLVPVTRTVWAASWPALTGPERFVRGSSLNIVAENAAQVAGPILGGWLIALLGPRPTFLVVAALGLAAVVLTLWASLSRPTGMGRSSLRAGRIWGDLRAGMRFLVGDPVLRYLLLLNCAVSLGWSAPGVAAVVYIADGLDLGGEAYGLLRGSMALSITLGVYILGRYARWLPWQRLLAGGAILAGLAYALVALEPSLLPLLGLWFLSGLGWAAFWLIDESLWARVTPDGIRGRVYSLADALIYLAEAATALAGGWLVGRLGPVPALWIVGGTVALAAVVLSASSRGFRAVAALQARPPQQKV